MSSGNTLYDAETGLPADDSSESFKVNQIDSIHDVMTSPKSGMICASLESCSSRTLLAFCKAGRSTVAGFAGSVCRTELSRNDDDGKKSIFQNVFSVATRAPSEVRL